MTVYQDLLASDLPDMPELAKQLCDYFPKAARDRVAAQIAAHPLRREIVATTLTNELVNRSRITFIHDMRARTGRSTPDIARAYSIVREVFGLRELWGEIEALDNKVTAEIQIDMLIEIDDLIERAAVWLLFHERLELRSEIARLGPSTSALAVSLAELLPPRDRAVIAERSSRFTETGVAPPLAGRLGGSIFLAAALEIADLAERSGSPLERAARVYYGVGARFAFDEMQAAAPRLIAETSWQKQAVEVIVDDLAALQADLASSVLTSEFAAQSDPVGAWSAGHAAVLVHTEPLLRELRADVTPDLAMLVVAARQLRQALDGAGKH